MAAPTEECVRGANPHVPQAFTGLIDLLDQHVRDRPEARALVATGDRAHVSYRTLAVLVDDVAVRLGSAGLRRGDAVGVICANTVEFAVAILGAARAGLVVAPLDPALPRSEVSARLERLGAQAILVGPLAADREPPAQFPVPTWELRVDIAAGGIATATLETGAGLVEHVSGATDDLSDNDALVLFTSGTTDQAKMVPLTHANVAASVQAICGS